MEIRIPTTEEAFRDYKDSLSSILFRYLKNTQDVEDVLQETFIKAITYNTTFRGESDYKTWVTRIAINTALNYIKANRKMGCIGFEDLANPDAAAVNICSAEMCAIAEEELEIMNKNVKNISEELWSVFVMVQFEGDSQDEVAAKLKIPEGTVKSRLSRVRKAILGLE
jgi:RNA polymerase sigma-70 factor, ECF subfamily